MGMRKQYGSTPKRCMALNSDGDRCQSNIKVSPVRYHGDQEIYRFGSSRKEPDWVVTYLCMAHREPTHAE